VFRTETEAARSVDTDASVDIVAHGEEGCGDSADDTVVAWSEFTDNFTSRSDKFVDIHDTVHPAWYSSLRSMVSNASVCPAARRSSSPFLTPATQGPERCGRRGRRARRSDREECSRQAGRELVSSVSRARNTWPMPPWPTAAMISYGPNRAPA